MSTANQLDAVLKHFDHVTIVVRDVERAKTFFGVLGFKQAISTVIAGEPFASYMGVPGIEAEHVTLVLENAPPRTEIQLLRYRHPQAVSHKLSFNHCFAVDDIEAEIAKMVKNRSALVEHKISASPLRPDICALMSTRPSSSRAMSLERWRASHIQRHEQHFIRFHGRT
jgi:catechol 2,3-dioxygenase-like lactoylglutathione lyase family enzyme